MIRLLTASAAAAILTVSLVSVAPGATANPVPTVVPCLHRSAEPVPPARRIADTPPVTQADLDAVGAVGATTAFSARLAGAQLPRRVTIPVYVHVIKGTRRGELSPAGPRRVKRLINILNGGFHGKQRRGAESSRYTFRLRHIDYTKNESWYHGYLFSPSDRRMKRALHRGGRATLNLYINGAGSKAQPVLGWSRFPWQYRSTPKLDGVSVTRAAMPGGSARHYNRGDTVIHETGHWMGLFHTFQRGCRGPGDKVADTQPEGRPSYHCSSRRDTCPNKPGFDPVHNFMDYSYDSCMNRFTAGQLDRMDRSFAKYRR